MSTRPRIAILDDYQNLAFRMADWSALRERCEVQIFDQHLSEEDAAIALQDFDAICLLRERMAVPRSLIERLPRLKFIAITGHLHRTLDMVAAGERGIIVSAAPRGGQGGWATAELSWGLLIALARHIPQEANAMRAGGWQNSYGTAIGGRTLGLLGLGRLGTYMVPIAKAFGMRVLAWSQNLTEAAATAAGAEYVSKDELFRQSDFVSVHLVLSERTHHIVGARELSLMKPSASIINTSRGPLIDTEALMVALRGQHIAGAALDTFDVEPLPDDDPLRSLPNVILTPHLGYTVEDLLREFYARTVENVGAWLDGAPLRVIGPH